MGFFGILFDFFKIDYIYVMKQKFKILILFLIIPMLSFTVLHKYYVSLTEIEFVEEKKSVQIISRVFIDDFERLLKERYDNNITLAIDNEKESVDFYINKYFEEKFKLKINDQPQAYKFLGKEYEEDIMLCYFEIENIDHIATIQVVNRVLFEIFPEQSNIIRLKINAIDKKILLTKENDKGLLNL